MYIHTRVRVHAQFLAALRARACVCMYVYIRVGSRSCPDTHMRNAHTHRVFYLFYLSAGSPRASPLGPYTAPHLNPIATTNADHHSRTLT